MDVVTLNTYLYRENYVRRGNKLKMFDVLKNNSILESLEIINKDAISEFVKNYIELQRQF